MKALSLLGVFLIARILVVVGHSASLSFWSPIAYLWQDLFVVLLFAGLDQISARRPWICWIVYGCTVLFVAINVPVFRLMSSPATLPMIHATRGALADSIRHHLTGSNLLLIALVLCAAAAMPLLLQSFQRKRWVGIRCGETIAIPLPAVGRGGSVTRRLMGKLRHPLKRHRLVAAAAILVALGPLATSRVETGGRDRNVFFALFESAMPRIGARPLDGNWRTSPMDCAAELLPQPAEPSSLTRFKGAATGRNVIMILLESTGAKYLKPWGAGEDPMPNLSALACQSILFENAYAVYPESIKGLFSVLCSRYPAFDTEPEDCAKSACPSIAARLVAEGYRTALFHSGRFPYLGMDQIVRQRGFQTLADAGDIGGRHESSFGVDEPATVLRMLNWIDALPHDAKFFLAYLPVAGHHPYDYPGPGRFSGTDDRGRYLNALNYGDEALGELFQGLKARGLFEKTLFVILGDHGEAFGQHDGNYGHTQFIYDENIHVPCLVAAPGLINQPFRVNRVTSLLDTAPTILDLLGMPIPGDYQGCSLLEPRGGLALFFADYALPLLGLRDGDWKFIHELDSGRSQLFDLSRDANETENLAAQRPDRVKAYRAHLKRWAAAQRDVILHPWNHPLSKR